MPPGSFRVLKTPFAENIVKQKGQKERYQQVICFEKI